LCPLRQRFQNACKKSNNHGHSPVVSVCASFCGRRRIAQSDFPPNPRRLGFWAPGDGLPLPPKSRTTGNAIRPVAILDCAILDRHAVLNVGSCHCRQLLGECLLLFRWQKSHEAKDHTQQGIRTAVLELYSRKEVGADHLQAVAQNRQKYRDFALSRWLAVYLSPISADISLFSQIS
jgi:hypothetical protein